MCTHVQWYVYAHVHAHVYANFDMRTYIQVRMADETTDAQGVPAEFDDKPEQSTSAGSRMRAYVRACVRAYVRREGEGEGERERERA